MTETTQTTNTKEINPMSIQSLLELLNIKTSDIDKDILNTGICLINNKVPCLYATISSHKQGEIDSSDINFHIYSKTPLSYTEDMLFDEDGNYLKDEDGFNEYHLKLIDLLNFLKINTDNIDSNILIKPLNITSSKIPELIPAVDIRKYDNNVVLLINKASLSVSNDGINFYKKSNLKLS